MLFGALVISACGTTSSSSTPPEPAVARSTWFRTNGVAFAPARDCTVESRYNEHDVTRIVRLRDNGDSLKSVAAEVGGTRQEVRCAEVSVITAKRNARLVQK